MKLEDEFLHRETGNKVPSNLSWMDYKGLSIMLSAFMDFLEEKEFEEDWDEEDYKFGEYISYTVQCDNCGHIHMATFPSHASALECPGCGKMSTFLML